MSGFAIKYPFFILMLCLAIIVVGVTTVYQMRVDLLPEIKIPVVVVATFYSGMPLRAGGDADRVGAAARLRQPVGR